MRARRAKANDDSILIAYSSNSAVQWGQRVAFTEISEKQ